MEQRVRENNAYASYAEIRWQLLEAFGLATISERLACQDCERLGREYGEAMFRHLNLEDKFMAAKIRHDHDQATALIRQLHDLASEMSRMRQAMMDHGKQAHPD